MDNKEVLVKINFTTKYGIQLNSSRVIKSFKLYKYLVLKNLIDQVYIDYSNEDCEIVDIKNVLENAIIITDKNQIESFNNIKQLLYKDLDLQYDLFTLIDNSYHNIFGYKVDKDLSFEKYNQFNIQLISLSKLLISKYIGYENFPKDINQLLLL